MTTVKEALSGKGHKDENFPVASWLLSEQRRGPIIAFYRFVRAADDVADHPTLTPETKLELLDDLDDALTGRGTPADEAEPLRLELAKTGLSPKHALDLLKAFRLDARKNRYANWSELMDYCALSAAPVGRFVLDVHEEDPSMWPASDALCSALQIINHLQDCAEDYKRLDRVYLPLDTLAAHGASVEMLDAPKAPPALRGALAELARRTSELVTRGAPLIPQIQDVRLGAEIAAIHALARRLARDLESRDPLSERVHLGKAGFALVGGLGAARFLGSAMMRVGRRAGESDRMSSQAAPAAHSSFYSAMRILPEKQREAMFALYGFCREVDDIADDRGPATAAERLAKLEQWRADIAAMFAGQAPPHLAALAEVTRSYHLKHEDFDAVIDGMAMDAEQDIRAPDWATLDLYCDRVASAVGRLSVRIFGLTDERGVALAHHLGRALQLTNILRDIDEDASIGRLYLPREALTAAGVTTDEPLAAAADPKLADACVEVAARAREHFEKAQSVMASAPRAAVKAPRLMAAAYGSILDRMLKEGFAPPRRRAKASRLRLLGALLRYGIL